MPESTLICTMGGQPQVVTFALDFLLARAEEISGLFVFHLSPAGGRVERALERLYREFDGNRYGGRPCRFRAIALKQDNALLPAIRSEADADTVRRAVFSLVAELKQAGHTLHFCLAGGPRMMGLMALSAAMLYCGHQDKVWHMYTEPDFLDQAQEGALMHDDTGRRVRLVQVPVVPWASYLPPFFQAAPDPAELMRLQTAWMDREEHGRCQAVWDRLSLRQREVLRGYARGLQPEGVARDLSIELKTVRSHSTQIYAECRLAWHLPEDYYLSFNFVRDRFRDFIPQP